MAKITTVIFDFYNTIMVNPELTLMDMVNFKRLHAKDKIEFKKISALCNEGKVSISTYLRELKKIFRLPGTIKQLRFMFDHTAFIEPSWLIFRQLSKNYKTAILTNDGRGGARSSARTAGITLPKNFFSSSEIGLTKPDPKIYKYVLQKLDSKPESTVYIDDDLKNVKAARKLGINAIQFDGNISKLLAALNKLGIKVRI
ncbi:HAD-IA family hydrolase [Patescibacteria group bacterium]|nr:HAD-IA family hydrolase [Patescibacteria group bacterium]